jgi:hypothetical protein
MVQPGHHLDLPEEPLGAHGRRELRTKHLDGHGTLVLEVLRQVHHGHAALTELALDAVLPREGSFETVPGVHDSNKMGRGAR